MTIFYPDIASYQAGIDLNHALAVGAKATEGTGYTNPSYAAFRIEAGKSGAFFFAYHFLSAGNVGVQAQHAFNVVGKDTPLMIDCEPAGSRPSLADATGFTSAYRKLGGNVNLIYLPRWYWESAPFNSVSLKPLQDAGLRLVSSDYSVAYTDDASGKGWLSYGGQTPIVWQYTNNVLFNGMKIDFNAFRGSGSADNAKTLAEFKAIVRTGKYPPVIPPVKPVPHLTEWSWVSNGRYSLAYLAGDHRDLRGEKLTPYRLIGTSAKHGTLKGSFGNYVNRGGYSKTIPWNEPVPAGAVIWFPAGW